MIREGAPSSYPGARFSRINSSRNLWPINLLQSGFMEEARGGVRMLIGYGLNKLVSVFYSVATQPPTLALHLLRPILRGYAWRKQGDDPMITPILIKRYARSRLYDAVNSRYVTVAQLRQWQRDGIAFIVRDAETGADVTRVLLG